jgi:hypothetical protein
MYCPSCGAECALELNYCNRCGANVAAAIAPAAQFVQTSITKPALVIGGLTTILTIGGFAVLAIGAFKLAQVLKDADPIIPMMIFGMATIMVSDIFLLRLLSRIVNSWLGGRQMAQLPRPQTREAPTNEAPRQLNPRLEPVPSVTDRTTRTFSPAYREAGDRGTK